MSVTASKHENLWFRPSKRFARTVVILALLTTIAFTQATRTISGRVTDEEGHVLVGAIVQLQNNSTFWIRSYVTQSDGRYHFEQLSTDDSYQVKAKYKNLSSRTKRLSKFSSRTLATIDLVIDLAHAKSQGRTP
jgi:hypothetical protein